MLCAVGGGGGGGGGFFGGRRGWVGVLLLCVLNAAD